MLSIKDSNDIKKLREEMDYWRDLLDQNVDKSRATDLMFIHWDEARMMFGNLLKILGNPTPYKNDGKRKDVKDIEKATDKHTQKIPVVGEIECLDQFRETVNRIVQNVEEFALVTDSFMLGFAPGAIIASIYIELTKARNWAGVRFDEIRTKHIS
jgi:hypothetical protein